jgi:hypothetical protein
VGDWIGTQPSLRGTFNDPITRNKKLISWTIANDQELNAVASVLALIETV